MFDESFGDIFNDIQPETNSFEPLPKGSYPVEVLSADVKQTKAGTGYYVNLRLKVIDGPCAKRELYDILNIKNPSEVAQRLGRERLSSLLLQVGVEPKDQAKTSPSFLVGKKYIASVGADRNDSQRNRIFGYSQPAGKEANPIKKEDIPQSWM